MIKHHLSTFRSAVWLSAGILASIVFLGIPSPAKSQSVGQLVNLSGSVQVGGQAARLLSKVHSGDVIAVGSSGLAEVVLFSNGARFRVPGGSSAVVGASSLTRRSGSAPQPLGSLGGIVSHTSGSGDSGGVHGYRVHGVRGDNDLVLGQPRPVGIIRSGPVTLSWAGGTGAADKVRVRVVDEDRTTTIASSGPDELSPSVHEFKIPAGKLEPGKKYFWSVAAIKGDALQGQKLEAPIEVLDTTRQAQCDKMEGEAAKAMKLSPKDPAPLLLLAQAYEQSGLNEEAIAKYQAALKLRPNDPVLESQLKALTNIKGVNDEGKTIEPATKP